MRRLALVLVLVVLLPALATACAAVVDEPPTESPARMSPPLLREAAAARGIERVTVPPLSRDSYERRAERLTVRVRNLSCEGVATGSGFAVDRSTLVTNRHVVAGADRLEVNTWDGRTLEVRAAEVGVLGDVAYVTVDGDLPVVADLSGTAAPGSDVRAVGYPLGGPFVIQQGTVVDRIRGDAFGVPGEILRISAPLQPGNSGGPLLDARGRVAGVVYAIEVATGFGLAFPISTMDALVAAAGTTPVPPCGSG